jgi:hypothetical protein
LIARPDICQFRVYCTISIVGFSLRQALALCPVAQARAASGEATNFHGEYTRFSRSPFCTRE